MAKVLSSISRDSPASPLSVNTGSTFSFAGTPTLTGSGGVQRYDFKWEVDSGSGYVTIGAATGLTAAGTNPLVNSNSQTQNAITVTCSDAGSYTIRMVGAPVSGGSYTILSATQTVTVALGAITGTLAATEAGADTASLSGTVAIAGSLAATEGGSDTFAGTGTVGGTDITGTLAATESGSDTATFSGMVLLQGLLAATESGSDAFAASGTVSDAQNDITGALAAVERPDPDTMAATGKIRCTWRPKTRRYPTGNWRVGI